MNKAAIIFCTLFLLAVIAKIVRMEPTDPNNYVRDRTVLLHGNDRLCTGTLIISPYTFKPYILTAAHCISELNSKGQVAANPENRAGAIVRLIKIDTQHDLMLLSSAWTEGLYLGEMPAPHDPVRTITWGAGEPPHVATGEVLESFMEFNELGFNTYRILTTAHIDHGSSGGPMVNAYNQLIGIVCVGYGETLFSNEAPVAIIKSFLADVKE